jgi:hypothetical protein
MKKSKSENITDCFLGMTPEMEKAQAARKELFAKQLGEFPSTDQIALLAAVLSRNIDDKPNELADRAMNLWLAAQERMFLADLRSEFELQDMHFVQLERESDEFDPGEEERFSASDKYPVTRDVFLRRVLPKYKHRTADLARIGKAFIRDIQRLRTGKDPTEEEIADSFGKWKTYEDQQQANSTANLFKDWYYHHVHSMRRLAGLKSAEAKKKKKLRRARPRFAELKKVLENNESSAS